MTFTLTVSLSGPDPAAIYAQAAKQGWAPPGALQSLDVDNEAAKQGETVAAALARAERRVAAYYENLGSVQIDLRGPVRLNRNGFAASIPRLLEQLAAVPFELASFASPYPIWRDADGERYFPPGFSEGHVELGWVAAFRGAGHDWLVSRRWLERGPWQLHRGPGDVSLLYFHDPELDPVAALAIARPAHEALIGDHGGFLQRPFVYEHDLGGLYEARSRTMKVVVLGREPSDRELLEWAALRAESGRDRPIDAVAFVFPDEREGAAQLPRLWRYGHQCWVIRAGDEVRLDGETAP